MAEMLWLSKKLLETDGYQRHYQFTNTPPTMTLPQETINRITSDAKEYAEEGNDTIAVAERMAYIAGATAEATRALTREKVLVDALKLAEMELKAMYKRLDFKGSNVLDKVSEALAAYTQEKESGNG